MADPQRLLRAKLERMRRAAPYIRQYMQTLRNKNQVSRMTFKAPYLIVLVKDTPLPNPLHITTPIGEVELRTYSARGRDEYDLLVKIYSLPSARRRKLFVKYPDLTVPQLPPQPGLGKLINTLLAPKPKAEEPPALEDGYV